MLHTGKEEPGQITNTASHCKTENSTRLFAKRVQRWANQRWHYDLKGKLTYRSVGSKQWWSSFKHQEGLKSDYAIPLLNKPDSIAATGNVENAERLVSYFSRKISILDPIYLTHVLPRRGRLRLKFIWWYHFFQNLGKSLRESSLPTWDNHPHNLKQFGFWLNRSSLDLLLNITANWSKRSLSIYSNWFLKHMTMLTTVR